MKLTQEEAAKYLPLVKAAAEGKKIQVRLIDDWIDMTESYFTCPPEHYRIKPEPKLRAWRPEEVPVGAQIRHKSILVDRGLILGTSSRSLRVSEPLAYGSSPYLNDLNEYEHSTDGGKTWKPCGVEE